MPNLKDQNLIFLHIPKNGGNTLHAILDRIYKEETTFNIKVIDNTKLNIQEFKDLSIENRSKINVLKGHMSFGLHDYLKGPSKYITFLRKPEDRIISFYHYAKSRPQHRLYTMIHEQNMSLLDFVIASRQGDVNNAQIRWISGLHDADEAKMLQVAKENIDQHFSFVGLQEHFDISLLMLSKLYGWGIPYYKYLNKGKHRVHSKTIDLKTKQAINERNLGDYELYDYVEKKFMEKRRQLKGLQFQRFQLRLANKLHHSYLFNKIKKKLKNYA